MIYDRSTITENFSAFLEPGLVYIIRNHPAPLPKERSRLASPTASPMYSKSPKIVPTSLRSLRAEIEARPPKGRDGRKVQEPALQPPRAPRGLPESLTMDACLRAQPLTRPCACPGQAIFVAHRVSLFPRDEHTPPHMRIVYLLHRNKHGSRVDIYHL
jgi:hypothetical protein